MGEGNQPIIPRDNPLARKLAAIGALNETYGVRAQGGAGAPIIPNEPGPSAVAGTVLPPDPVPVTPEEEAELQRKFDQQWGNHPTAEAPVAPLPPPGRRSALAEVPQGFAAIDIVHSQVIGLNGTTYPIEEAERKELLTFCFRAMVRSMNQEINKIAAAMGIDQGVKGDTADGEAMPKMREDQATK